MTTRWRTVARAGVASGAVAVLLTLAGCELAALVAGKGTQPALYDLPKNARVLVLVDVQNGVHTPPLFTSELGEGIGRHLFHYKAADQIVAQERLTALQKENSARYEKMGVADIARACDADVVLCVRIMQLETPSTTDATVIWGNAAADVKVVDRNGNNLWPGSPVGTRVVSRVQAGLNSEHDAAAIIKTMMDQLTLRTGRMFHSYSADDKILAEDGRMGG